MPVIINLPADKRWHHWISLFFDEVPEEPVAAVRFLSAKYAEWRKLGKHLSADDSFEELVQFTGMFGAVADLHGLAFTVPDTSVRRDNNANMCAAAIEQLIKWAQDHHTYRNDSELLQRHRNEFAAKLGRAFAYAFTDPQFHAIQDCVNKLREAVRGIDSLVPDHKGRLLRKIDAVQSELNPRMASFDRIAGLTLDSFVLLGRIGEEARPALDCVERMWGIVKEAIHLTTGLPTGSLGLLAASRSERRNEADEIMTPDLEHRASEN